MALHSSHDLAAILALLISYIGIVASAYAETAQRSATTVRVSSHKASMLMYFGNGCFFAHQYLFLERFERGVLNRMDGDLTAVQGYAGSLRTGPRGTACYHNSHNFSDYGALGHGEVVEVDVPLNSLHAAFEVYFGSFVEISQGVWTRPDFYDRGPGYRSLVGVPGGVNNTLALEAIRKTNGLNLTIKAGQGDDPDTFTTNTVFVMDSTKFHFIQAELCLQFHDDSQAKYPDSYHRLRYGFEDRGRLVNTTCPPNFICTSSLTAATSGTVLI